MLNFIKKGEGPAVVLIHGYLESGCMWKRFEEEMSGKYKLIIVDLPGHGKSNNYSEIHSMEFMAEKVYEILDYLAIEKALVVGHSMGGYVALALAELFPEIVKGLVLLNSSSLSDSKQKKENRVRIAELAKRNLNTVVKMSLPLLFNQSNLHLLKKEKKIVKEMALKTSLEGIQAALKGMGERKDRTFILEDFEGSIGIVLGKFDRTIDPKLFKEVIPSRENIEILELHTGHMSYLEDEKNTLKFVENFSSKVFY